MQKPLISVHTPTSTENGVGFVLGCLSLAVSTVTSVEIRVGVIPTVSTARFSAELLLAWVNFCETPATKHLFTGRCPSYEFVVNEIPEMVIRYTSLA